MDIGTAGLNVRKKGISAPAVCFVLLEAFCALSLVYSAVSGRNDKILICVSGMLLLLLPATAERLLRIKIAASMKCILLVYAISGPVLGHVYRFYYTFRHWDKLMHILCGVFFAAFGYCLPDCTDCGRRHSRRLKLWSAFCLAMTVASLWEFFEFGMDVLIGTDMQNDTVLHGFTSYLLGSEPGITESLEGITEVAVNGVPLGIDGYLDIGLYDTMLDMIVCAAGAAGFCLFASLRYKNRDCTAAVPVGNGNQSIIRR